MNNSTIAAISTPPGTGGIAVIRLSGPNAFTIADKIWKGSTLSDAPSHSAHLGDIIDSDGSMLDQAVATVFHEGKSFTGEPTVEFSVHGSKWIQQRVVQRLIEAGASAASAGEFTQRAFVNGRLDLAQAEAIADMIAASSKASQRLAATQMKGSFSKGLNSLRNNLIDIASLLELELDFSEEDVEFADRSQLISLSEETLDKVSRLADSFSTGRALKEGVNVVIAGRPNSGKSTLLNLLLQDDKAIVSDIAGTTRDIIEDTIEINGILFRFADTAGLRDTADEIERIGVDKARARIATADILLWLIDASNHDTITEQLTEARNSIESLPSSTHSIILLNKTDIPNLPVNSDISDISDSSASLLRISAKTASGIDTLTNLLSKIASAGHNPSQELIVTNARHYEALRLTAEALRRVIDALHTTLPSDLIAQDLREAIHHLGTITGAITPTDLLQTIFSRFCIGK